MPLVPPSDLLLDADERGRRHVDENGRPVSFAESVRRQRDVVPTEELPTWDELADAKACAACLGGDGASLTLCDECNCGFHPKCVTTLCELTQPHIEGLSKWYCAICRPTWATGLPTAVLPPGSRAGSDDDSDDDGDGDGDESSGDLEQLASLGRYVPPHLLADFGDMPGAPQELKDVADRIKAQLRRGPGGAVIPLRGVLLFGPSGTGKTSAAAAIARQSGYRFFRLPEVLPTDGNQKAKCFQEVIQAATKHAPSIVFIDEVDTILSKKTTVVVGAVAGMWKSAHDLLFVGATNEPGNIHEKLLDDRFSCKIHVPLPERGSTKLIIERRMRDHDKYNNTTSEMHCKDWDTVLHATAGRSVRNLLDGVSNACLRAEQGADKRLVARDLVQGFEQVARPQPPGTVRHLRITHKCWLLQTPYRSNPGVLKRNNEFAEQFGRPSRPAPSQRPSSSQRAALLALEPASSAPEANSSSGTRVLLQLYALAPLPPLVSPLPPLPPLPHVFSLARHSTSLQWPDINPPLPHRFPTALLNTSLPSLRHRSHTRQKRH